MDPFEEFMLDYTAEEARKLTQEDIFWRVGFEKRLKTFEENLPPRNKSRVRPLSPEILERFQKVKERLGIKDGI